MDKLSNRLDAGAATSYLADASGTLERSSALQEVPTDLLR